jgi:hypothetical protein
VHQEKERDSKEYKINRARKEFLRPNPGVTLTAVNSGNCKDVLVKYIKGHSSQVSTCTHKYLALHRHMKLESRQLQFVL